MEKQIDELSHYLQGAVRHLENALQYVAYSTFTAEGTDHKAVVDHYYQIVKQALDEVETYFVREDSI